MKIRNGFVSNSSSSCFVCHAHINENDDLCDKCKSNQNVEIFLDIFEPYLTISREEARKKYREYVI